MYCSSLLSHHLHGYMNGTCEHPAFESAPDFCTHDSVRMHVKRRMHTIMHLLLECLQSLIAPPLIKLAPGERQRVLEVARLSFPPLPSPLLPTFLLLRCLQRHPCHFSIPGAPLLLFFPNFFRSFITSPPYMLFYKIWGGKLKKKAQRQETAWWECVSILTVDITWCKSATLFCFSLIVSSVPNCLLWQTPPYPLPSFCCHYGERDFSFSCFGGKDQSMWCSVSLIKMSWLYCLATASLSCGWELKH